MSEPRTPLLVRALVTALTARLARCSAVLTEGPFACTPMYSISWSGVPLPVTVILAPGAAACAATVRPGSVAASPRAPPAANAPISRPAAATPAATARWVTVSRSGMAGLPRCRNDHRFDARSPLAVPPAGGPRCASSARMDGLGRILGLRLHDLGPGEHPDPH